MLKYVDLTRIKIISAAETALKKLKKEGVPAYNVKKEGAGLIFSVKDKDVKKVFAIFNKPCYNISVYRESVVKRAFSFVKLRAGLFAGALLFAVCACFANGYVLKIEVSGSGSYLETEILRIIADEGAGAFRPFSSLNVSQASGRILSLPQVTFCNISKKGSVLVVDVQADAEHNGAADRRGLFADCSGTVKNIVAVCGTPAVKAGDAVKKGDALIYPKTLAGEKEIDCLAAGYAEIECARTAEYFATEESEENLKNAYASPLIDGSEILARKHTVKPTEGGVIYVIEFTCLHKVSINLE